MDINETLRKLRKAVAAELISQDGSHAGEIADLFDALDGWMSRGGFLPDGWPVLSGNAPTTWDRHGIAADEDTHPNEIAYFGIMKGGKA